MGARLMAVVAEGERGRVYLSPTADDGSGRSVRQARRGSLNSDVPTTCHDVDRLPMYGMTTWGDLFTSRQLVALTTFSDLVREVRERVRRDALAAGMPDDDGSSALRRHRCTQHMLMLCSIYLGFVVDKAADYNSSFCGWIAERGDAFEVRSVGKRFRWTGTSAKPIHSGRRLEAFESGIDQVAGMLDSHVRQRFNRVRDSRRMHNQCLCERSSRLHGSAVLRQHQLRRPFRLLLRVAPPLAEVHLPGPICHPRSAQGGGVGGHALPTREQGEGGGILPRRHDASDASSGGASPPRLPGHHLLRIQADRERWRGWDGEHRLGHVS